jgi:tetraacyldisaccharide 4'-kinase
MRAPKFWNAQRLSGRALSAALSPFGALYGLSVRIKERGARPFRPKARVICVGNLTVGGSGKTPVAIALGHVLAGHGRRVVFLTRGYGGRTAGPLQINPETHTAEEVGDEPLLLASIAPTVVARDRAKGAALADELRAEIIVMDDGFQNFSIEKDLSLVIVDAETGFGNRRLIPAGPLRETPEAGLARAHAVVLMNGDTEIPEFAGERLRARIELADSPRLAGKKVMAFAGIGRPEKFFATLREMGAIVVDTRSFPDHHNFSHADIEKLKTRADALNAFLVTTEKDFVRLDADAREGVLAVPVRAVLHDAVAWSKLLGRLA